MYFASFVCIPTVVTHMWYIYTCLINVGLYLLLAWICLKSLVTLYRCVGTPPSLATSHTEARLPGKLNSVECSSVIPPFHPNAPAQSHDTLLDLLLRFLDKIPNRLAASGQTLLGMVLIENILRLLTEISDIQGPLNARLNRGIAQISALRAGVVTRGAVFRYLFLVIFPCSLFVGLVLIVGISIEFVIPMYLGALVFAVAVTVVLLPNILI
ncbi:hypothetical protein OPQ81_011510 [Rhizoctonia solani]|nr:hypothetical protein OPQ81_011510 [Rhizoctonia solani]